MEKKNETKVVCIGGVGQSISISDRTKGLTSEVSQSQLFAFAEETIVKLRECEPAFLWDGLIRIDIFKTKAGKLVVNEVESLDSNFSHSKMDKQLELESKLTIYWKHKIRDCFKRLKNSREY